jgi:hypothetical protein
MRVLHKNQSGVSGKQGRFFYLCLAQETLQPGAFAMDQVRHASHQMDWFLDVLQLHHPHSLGLRRQHSDLGTLASISILEAVSGNLYVTVLVTRLVGLYSAGTAQLHVWSSRNISPERIKAPAV